MTHGLLNIVTRRIIQLERLRSGVLVIHHTLVVRRQSVGLSTRAYLRAAE